MFVRRLSGITAYDFMLRKSPKNKPYEFSRRKHTESITKISTHNQYHFLYFQYSAHASQLHAPVLIYSSIQGKLPCQILPYTELETESPIDCCTTASIIYFAPYFFVSTNTVLVVLYFSIIIYGIIIN